MEGREGNDGIEPARGWLPCLEIGVDHFDFWEAHEIGARHSGELLTEFDACDPVAALRHGHGGLSGAASDLNDARRVGQLGERDEVVEYLRRVLRSGVIVEGGKFLERCS